MGSRLRQNRSSPSRQQVPPMSPALYSCSSHPLYSLHSASSLFLSLMCSSSVSTVCTVIVNSLQTRNLCYLPTAGTFWSLLLAPRSRLEIRYQSETSDQLQTSPQGVSWWTHYY